MPILFKISPFTRQCNFSNFQVECICKRQIKYTCQQINLTFIEAENVEGKGENAGRQHFLLFPQCFQKAFSSEPRFNKLLFFKGLTSRRRTLAIPIHYIGDLRSSQSASLRNAPVNFQDRPPSANLPDSYLL